MRQNSTVSALKALTKRHPTDDEAAAVSEELNGDSDRSASIVWATFVEDAVAHALKSPMPNLTSDLEDSLFGPSRPLTSFSAKIDLAYTLGIIDVDTKRDLHYIREIRNACAHSKVAINFETSEVIAVCRLLSVRREVIEDGEEVTGAQMRLIYMMACSEIRDQMLKPPTPSD